MAKRPQFEIGGIYHVFNRGVEKRDIYVKDNDYFRFIFSLYECNDKNPVDMRDRISARIKRKKEKNDKGPTFVIMEREPLVEILAFILMPNHYHLIVRQVSDDGVSLFMKKLGNSYVGYFNDKHERKGMGSLFQGKFKAVHIKTDEQFIYLVWYVFTNPLDLLDKNWRERGVKNIKEASEHMQSYKWSSYLDYIGIKNFPSVISKEFLTDSIGDEKKIKKFIEERITETAKIKSSLNKIEDLILE